MPYFSCIFVLSYSPCVYGMTVWLLVLLGDSVLLLVVVFGLFCVYFLFSILFRSHIGYLHQGQQQHEHRVHNTTPVSSIIENIAEQNIFPHRPFPFYKSLVEPMFNYKYSLHFQLETEFNEINLRGFKTCMFTRKVRHIKEGVSNNAIPSLTVNVCLTSGLF